MRIAIDARFYGEAGPGRYVSELLKNLEKIDRENDYTVYLKASNFESYIPSNIRFKKILADFHWYSLSEQLIFPLMLYRGRYDLVHFTQINVPLLYFGNFVVTIHDVIMHEFSTERGRLPVRLLYRLKKLFYYLVFAKDVYLSRQIIVPSYTTKKDIVSYYGVREEKIVVTYESVDHYPSSRDISARSSEISKYGVIPPYILFLGSFYPHKNANLLVEAYRKLKEGGNFNGQLVLVGKESFFSKRLREQVGSLGISGVVFPAALREDGYLPDVDVELLLSQSLMLVQPALKEGFGIPPVEAMVFGVPTIVSDIPCLREMCSESSLYFDPKSVTSLVENIIRLLSDSELRRKLIEKGYDNVKRFSWEKMAGETLVVYKNQKF